MNVRGMLRRLQERPFQPFAIVTSGGERHEIEHPENTPILPGGVMYIFRPVESEEAQVDFPVSVSLLHVTTLEPLTERAA